MELFSGSKRNFGEKMSKSTYQYYGRNQYIIKILFFFLKLCNVCVSVVVEGWFYHCIHMNKADALLRISTQIDYQDEKN